MTDTILLTGGTGFLGTLLAARLCQNPAVKTYVLVRATDEDTAVHRLKAAWQHERKLYEAIGDTVIPVCGDFTKEHLGLDGEKIAMLRESVSLILHAGAEIGFQKSERELTETNLTGTENMIAFAKGVKELRRFVFISTAYVAGQKSGLVPEDTLDTEAFSSLYEKSKAGAEALVRASGLPWSICRPGMILGDSKTGWIRNFNTIYYVLKLMLLGKLPVLPVEPELPLNLVPGDYVADCVLIVSFAEKAEGKTFHLTCPREKAPKAKELADAVAVWAKENLKLDLPEPRFIPAPLKSAGILYNKKRDNRRKNLLSNLLTLLPYFYGEQLFDRSNTDEVCGPYTLDWRANFEPLLRFACRKNFMRQTGQTVFQQAQVRRASRRYPISYYDVGADGIRKTTGPEANARIERILDALWAWGIRKGDRVALTGINSVAYMTLEQAIGLLGAVSVPIYYTTPAAEASVLLKKSGAKWFFVGDKRMMKQLPQMETEAKIVSFSAGEEILDPRAMRWGSFMARRDGHAPKQYPDPDDLATIRYTSGTTGEPKGVMFSFAQLAWMGEVLTNLLSWEDRNRPLRYLSFLPLSHVVEGILASYAPYYLLSEVGYYYLNDFGSLTDALPKVRPNIFFSVPRFYEKLWDQVTANKVGKAWLAEKPGAKKQAMGVLLRTVVLRKAGIDQCRQLIVGSAPVSEALLQHFRELGIEVHNAYGQTEAPLITINRLGDNVIPGIGTPLPDTTVTLEPDGELIVAGPQVTLGYYGLETPSIQNGVLRTGDLGTVDDTGHITLFGRKKDFIVTAYGKNISIPKLEERLKDIPGVSEAVLIGEKRPYCTALLWLEGEVSDLKGQIERMNADLSHPEQIRDFRVIEKPLSIQAGELTPNLKVKRANVEKHFAQEIEEMYG